MPKPAPDKVLNFCLPVFAPDAGHENKLTHDASAHARYYAVVSEEWSGVVTSQTTLHEKLKRCPKARTFSAASWRVLMDLWNDDCERNHHHNPSQTVAREMSPMASASTAQAYTQGPRGPSPTKGWRVAPPHITSTPGSSRAFPTSNNPMANTDEIAARFEAWAQRQDTERTPALFYGVSGHNRVFGDWGRAMAVFRKSPGADLIFAYNEDQVQAFVREEAERMIMEAET
ncbi:hypothetical protein B0H12DRAFT_1237123 [Mycena haematopus]|nr:hypothetical protein B0H12DRAFT_1237123 [Mycena haematopus]